MVTQSLSDSGRWGRDVSLKFTTLMTGKQVVDGYKTSFLVQILMLVNFIRKMVKYFTGNVNSQKEVQAVRFGLRPGLGCISFCRGKGMKTAGDPGLSHLVHPSVPSRRGYDLETDTLYLTVSRQGVGARGNVSSVVLALCPGHPPH